MHYVIIGNSASGIAAIESIRETDTKNKITVISDEPYSNYSRPLISYLLARKVGFEAMLYREESFYKNNNVDLILNKRVIDLNLHPVIGRFRVNNKKFVVLSNNRKISFDKLLIATGGIPIIPEIKGIDLKGVFTFVKMADVGEIEKYIKTNKVKNAVVIGGGLIGLKATEALIELKINVSIIELADRILSATFDKKASFIIENALEKIGCKLVTNNTVIEIKNQKSKVKNVILKDGREIGADLVIITIGVRPSIELVKNTPIKTNRGILVNNLMRTNVNDVYAAGDCCEAKDLILDINRPIAIWPVAIKQGRIAGFNMAGIEKEYQGGFVMNSVELCNIPTISMGESCPTGEGYQIVDCFVKDKSLYKKIVLKDGRIIGAIFINDIERVGIYTGLIKDKVDISSCFESVSGGNENILRKDFGLICLPKEYRKHLVANEEVII